MTYNMALHHPQFFDNTNSDDQFGEDLTSMDWNMNIDPSLDSFSFQQNPHSQPPICFQVQQQVQQQLAPEKQHPQQIQHPTMQRFVNEPQRQFFTAPNIPQDILNLQHASMPTSSLPRASHQRMASPSFSHDLTSSSGSANSPPAEQDFYPENGHYANGTDNPYYRQSFPDPQGGPASYQAYALPQQQGFSCVSMDQIQGFVDTDDGYFEHEEDLGEVAMKCDYAVEVHNHSQTNMNTSTSSQGYCYPSDEGIGDSIQDEASPKNTIHVDDTQISDIDAEADMSDIDAEPEHIPSTPASDTEYTPKLTRTRKRRPTSPNTKTPPSQRRHRISKTPQKTKGQITCKSCSHAPFKDTTSLQRHIASAHTRAYVCVFDFAGCNSTFASKNEWKRHVSSQHLNLTAWVCELGSCGSHYSKAGISMPNSKSSNHGNGNGNGNGAGTITRGSEFNRKDLFTQHLRRMHVPVAVKRKKVGTDAAWEEHIKQLQQTCLKTKRQAPNRLACPVCGTGFEGSGCWDDRMEHVGKHLEAQALGKCVVRQGDDALLLEWAVREGIVESRGDGSASGSGGFKLVLGGGVGGGGPGRKATGEVVKDERNGDEEEGDADADADAECEDE
ncbi:hypothetical protein ONS95_002999 [Cadophora gregata]|uniref:uncharacterized protein n=1 Tax=Cadophora gregata TaxID=51156 RepID=UPI0026DD023F|nr:uncharacterized protein ONS95_002999 [Cadophora gregata]KAK0108176.1 hypothetical protein ONS95_002999 [Cadophora gregata]KAK0109231.1 hypothetical protein ONS96_003052 [Cadophora gregata f. sp. sojae]